MDSPAVMTIRQTRRDATGVSERLFASLLLWILLLISAGAVPACEGTRSNGETTREGFERVTIDGHTFELELATDLASRTKGLMGRTEIPENGGMLFIFPRPARQGFWMKDCLVDIDIIYLDAFGRITAMHRMTVEEPKRPNETEFMHQARLKRYPSRLPAQFVIELKAGWLDQLDIEVEDKIELDLDRLKAMAE